MPGDLLNKQLTHDPVKVSPKPVPGGVVLGCTIAIRYGRGPQTTGVVRASSGLGENVLSVVATR